MDTTKEKIKHHLTLAMAKVKKIDPNITDKYYVKEIYAQMPKKHPSRMSTYFEYLVFISFIFGITLGLVFYTKPI